MRVNQVKLFAIILFAIALSVVVITKSSPTKAAAAPEDPAVTYKAKCMACHTATASKFFDPAKTDEEHVTIIMKGKKGEKPPFMPGFEAKGMTEADAKALVAYMKTLKGGTAPTAVASPSPATSPSPSSSPCPPSTPAPTGSPAPPAR